MEVERIREGRGVRSFFIASVGGGGAALNGGLG